MRYAVGLIFVAATLVTGYYIGRSIDGIPGKKPAVVWVAFFGGLVFVLAVIGYFTGISD